MVAAAGANIVSLPSGRTIPANSSCTVSVNVTAPLVGSYVNTLPIGALQTSNGNNLAPAVATLTVLAQIPPVVGPAAGAAVPTISEWILVLLSAALAVFAVGWMRRHDR